MGGHKTGGGGTHWRHTVRRHGLTAERPATPPPFRWITHLGMNDGMGLATCISAPRSRFHLVAQKDTPLRFNLYKTFDGRPLFFFLETETAFCHSLHTYVYFYISNCIRKTANLYVFHFLQALFHFPFCKSDLSDVDPSWLFDLEPLRCLSSRTPCVAEQQESLLHPTLRSGNGSTNCCHFGLGLAFPRVESGYFPKLVTQRTPNNYQESRSKSTAFLSSVLPDSVWKDSAVGGLQFPSPLPTFVSALQVVLRRGEEKKKRERENSILACL
ncbi:hypothetical protein QBC38DRAFT_130763 [Podospora fimiseda]|uniref:Uncharacterized protein n=1 Tax=Podospora fimiseda TaxID=252190 RepID=A0AAN6YLD9_9PEZI|nr:hypothetical protein QBC38DRAFT_130763 [Podospora fimiseda]